MIDQGSQVYVVGKVLNFSTASWEFQGVFATEEEARDQCRTAFYFVGPAIVGQALPDEQCQWSGAYYPLDGVKNEA